MKNIYRLLALVMPFFAVSCVDNLVEDNPVPDSGNRETVTITLDAGVSSKTMLVGDESVMWEEGDVVFINNELFSVVPSEEYINLAYVENVPVADSYVAYYSAQWYYLNDNGVDFHLPSTQEYREGSFAQFANPMVAIGSGSDTYLSFFNAASVLKLGVKGDDVSLSSVSIAGNNGEIMAGNFFVSFDDFLDGTSDFEAVPYEPAGSLSIKVALPDSLKLSETPQYIYAVIPSQTYEKGFTVTLTDTEGRICVQSTTKTITANRAEILDMAEFTFAEVEAMGVSDIVPSASSVSYSVKASPNSTVKTVVVNKLVWDSYLEGSFKEKGEEELATAFLNSHGTSTQIGEDGKAVLTDTKSWNSSGYKFGIMADRDYKLLVAYTSGNQSTGDVLIKDFRSAPATGEAPVLSFDVKKINKRYHDFSISSSSNTIDILNTLQPSSYIEELLAQGKTEKDILEMEGWAFAQEDLNAALSSAYEYTHPQLRYDTDYCFLLMAIGDNGTYKVERVDFSTDPCFDPAAQWETYTTKAAIDCGFLYVFGFDQNVRFENLTVEKMVGEDVFRVADLASRVSAYFIEKYPEKVEEGWVTLDDIPGYWYIDATDANRVVVPLFMGDFKRGGQEVCYFSGLEAFPNETATFGYGTYDKAAGTIDCGDLFLYDRGVYYSQVGRTYLYLNKEEQGGGLTNEDFTNSDPSVDW